MRLRLKKRTSINSKDSQLHKEKEMADFRKWFFAFAAIALISSFAVPVSAQTTPALQCTANAGVPPTVRAEGLTELVGDLVLNCNGGTATANGQPVPQANVTVFLGAVNITSRLTSGSFSEALLIVDEPHSASNPTVPLSLCDPTNVTLGVCSINGTGSGLGTYSGAAGRPNVFQGRQTGANQITFFGVPIDAPGTSGTRIFRVTNIRGNANQLGTSSTLIPTQITEFISVTGSTSLPINNPQQTVAFVQPGLTSTLKSAFTFIQCVSANSSLASSPSNQLGTGGQNGQQFGISFTEGFGSSFKAKNIQTQVANFNAGTGTLSYPADAAQDIPGAVYNTETGFLVNGVAVTPQPANLPANVTPFANPAMATTRGGAGIGVATQGTRLMIAFNSIASGAGIFVPVRIPLVRPLDNTISGGVAVLVSTDANGAGGFSPVSATNGAGGLAPVTVSSGGGVAVYEILAADPFQIESLTVPVAVAFLANAGTNLPAPGVQSTATRSFAPLSNVSTADASAPIPRFAPSSAPSNSFIINKCSCNLLFPFVTNQQGFDTGVAIANTSVDPYGTTPQAGTVTLNYYSGGTPPPAATTNAPVPGGQILTFTLSGGGNFGIPATPGFQGYIIAQAQFQFCHAFAYISAQGALPTAPGASEGYLGIVLDAPALNRTGQGGEVQAH
jgi:hypothetical protein